MPIPRLIACIASAGLMLVDSGIAAGQNFPTKPIRIITSGAGGDSDYMARVIAQGISGPLGQQVVVVNYPSGVVPGQTASKAPPDGYTLLLAAPSFWIGPLLRDDTPYDPIRDFSPIATLVRLKFELAPSDIIFARQAVGVKSEFRFLSTR